MKPKILFILHLPPPVHGAGMVGQFIKESFIINNSFMATYINLSVSNKVDEVGKGGFNKILATVKIAAKVLRALSIKRYDLCYMTLTAKGYGFYKDFIIVVILKLFKSKIIYHFHNKGIAKRQNKVIDNILYKITFKGTQSVLLSSLLYADIAKYVQKKNAFVCANGIPTAKGALNIKKTGEREAGICRLLFLSNMVVEKGVLVLLEACRLMKERKLLFECHFVGDWADVTEAFFFDMVAKNGLLNYVHAHGKKYNEEKFYFYNSSDIFVFPTFYHNECFPLVLLEAMQFGLPIVSTDEGGIAEIITNGVTGFIVRRNNAIELSEKLEILINNRELRLQMGTAGKNKFEQEFTLSHFEKCLFQIVQKSVES